MHRVSETDTARQAWWMLTMNTLAFTVCFAVWMMNGVLITFLVDNGVYHWTPTEMGWLIGIPVLTGALARLPLGVATDTWGGHPVFGTLLLVSAVPTFLLGYCDSYQQFCLASLGFGLSGASFAVGVAYTSVWFPKQQQGTALGIFGLGNIGAALTSLTAPQLLNWLTDHGEHLDNWRQMPKLYAGLLLAMSVVFVLSTKNRTPSGATRKSLVARLAPLANLRVWRFGLYYFFVFGGFVGLAQWLLPYYVSVYGLSVAMAGALAACNSLPSAATRAIGGWMSDRWGARAVMYWVFSLALLCCALLVVPQMELYAPGSGVMARLGGTVIEVSPTRVVVRSPKLGDVPYALASRGRENMSAEQRNADMLVWPTSASWQEPVVQPGETIVKRQLLARGVTHIFFQANMWIFTAISMALGVVMGIGMAAVYKHIPDYFPNDVGVVGGIVGVLGGLGGFVYPVIFGSLLQATGLWTTCWMLFFLLGTVCLVWMHLIVRGIMRNQAPELMRQIEPLTATTAPPKATSSASC
jgi:NNP family nitrate/nitrite transporter-like MFS transporter